MMISAKRLALLVAILGLMSARDARVEAGLVTYTETVTGSGTFAGSAYTNQLVKISLTADTSGITQPSTGLYETPTLLATITVGSTSGTISAYAFDNQSSGGFGFNAASIGGLSVDILDINNTALTTYNLSGPTTLLTGSGTVNANASYQTSAGAFNLNTFSGQVSFFASVPEPSSLALCGIAGAIALGCARVRRQGAGKRSH